MTRNGKIARLPKDIREELNVRLQNGHSGSRLLQWLNHLPECQEMLADYFDCQPITKQNLSEWKLGGYKEWLRLEEARQHVQSLAENAEDLEAEAGAMSIADRLGTVVSMQLLAMIEQLESIAEPKERWAQLREILRELHHLRREDHRARRLRLTEEQWKIKCDREAEREKRAEAERLLKLQGAMEDKLMLSKIKGRGDEAWKWTDWELRVEHGLPMPRWWNNPQTAEEWSKLMQPLWAEQVAERREEEAARAAKDGKSQGNGNIQHPTPSTQHPMEEGGEDEDGDCPTSASVQPGQTDQIEPGTGSKSKMDNGKQENGGMNSALQVQPGQTKSDQSDLVKAESGDGNGSESKVGFEDDPPSSGSGATRDEKEDPPSSDYGATSEDDSGHN